MLKKVLIANRGEIAVRIIRACRELNIRTVAIYSKADDKSLHIALADEAVLIGPAKSSESYLNKRAILQVAISKNCDGIHPGYGFLSENEEFAKMVEDEGIVFIGPSSKAISLMGDKIRARNFMMENGVNVIEGSINSINTVKEAYEISDKIGYPILLKASGGGGGKGIRKVYRKEELKKNYESAKAEVLSNFSNSDMYIEKYIENPRHIEIQILADGFGNVISLSERNCSIQINNQKVIEEAPAFKIPDRIRKEMARQAIRAAKACDYKNAGTVEFIVDKNNDFYFIEMNTRLQVEHTVTEEIMGIDIVKEQLRIASGFKLDIDKEALIPRGYAIECRINALDPLDNFRPGTGRVKRFNVSGGYGVRFDTSIYQGVSISPYYDSMIGKLIVYDKTRMGAIRKLRRALEETIIEGVKTNIDFVYALTFNKDFIKGNYNTSFINDNLKELITTIEGFVNE